MQIIRIVPTIKHYAWGSRTYLPDLLDVEPDGEPWAELWVGTHPAGMSLVAKDDDCIPLSDILGHLGTAGTQNGGLSFLCKILAIDAPLSIQCHPTREQAVEGFRREETAGIALDSPERNYKDSNHKPEIICAITPMTALSGLRDPQDILSGFDRLGSQFFMSELRSILTDDQYGTAERLRAFVMTILRLEGDRRVRFTEEIKQGLETLASSDLMSPELDLMRRLLHYYPEDPAICAPLYLHLYSISPGEALYQKAGVLHAYMEGVGMELMANSDNVLRGGLTPKHIDHEELDRIVDWEPSGHVQLEPEQRADGAMVYQTPAQEFELTRFTVGSGDQYRIIPDSPVFLICVSGKCELLHFEQACENGQFAAASGPLRTQLDKGDILCVIPSGSHIGLDLCGDGEVFLAGAPGALTAKGLRS